MKKTVSLVFLVGFFALMQGEVKADTPSKSYLMSNSHVLSMLMLKDGKCMDDSERSTDFSRCVFGPTSDDCYLRSMLHLNLYQEANSDLIKFEITGTTVLGQNALNLSFESNSETKQALLSAWVSSPINQPIQRYFWITTNQECVSSSVRLIQNFNYKLNR